MGQRQSVPLGVLAAVVLAVVLASVAVSPAKATSCTYRPANGFAADGDGGWWVVSGEYYLADAEHNSYLYHVSSTGDRRSETAPPIVNTTETEVGDVARGTDGRWYLLTARKVVVYGPDWRPLNRTIQVRTGRVDREETTASLTQSETGVWWVVSDGQLRRYSPDWEVTAAANLSADAVTTDDGRVWILRGGDRVSRVRYEGGEIRTSALWSVDRSLHVTDLTRTDGGYWKLLDGNGVVHRYTPYGQYTGDSSSLPVEANVDCAGLGAGLVWVLLLPVGVLVWGVVPLGVAALARRERWPELASAVALGAGGALAFRSFWLPWPFSVVYWLPDPLLGAVLVVPVAGLLARVRDDPPLVALLCVLQAPLVLVAWTFLTSIPVWVPLVVTARFVT